MGTRDWAVTGPNFSCLGFHWAWAWKYLTFRLRSQQALRVLSLDGLIRKLGKLFQGLGFCSACPALSLAQGQFPNYFKLGLTLGLRINAIEPSLVKLKSKFYEHPAISTFAWALSLWWARIQSLKSPRRCGPKKLRPFSSTYTSIVFLLQWLAQVGSSQRLWPDNEIYFPFMLEQ